MDRETERFKKMVQSSQDVFWEFDENANFTYVSEGIRNLLGYDPEELIGLNAFDLMNADEAARVHSHFDPIAKRFHTAIRLPYWYILQIFLTNYLERCFCRYHGGLRKYIFYFVAHRVLRLQPD